MKRLLFTTCLIAVAVTAGPADNTTWTKSQIPQAAIAAVIDGSISANEWQDAAICTGFIQFVGSKLVDNQPIAYLKWTPQALQIAVETPLEPGKLAIAKATDFDGAVWEDDSVEIHLDPTHSHEKNYQFVVNALGVRFDSIQGDKSFDGIWTAAAKNTPGRWYAEVEIPWTTLSLEKAPTDVFGINIAVNSKYLGGILTWSTMRGRRLHRAEDFAHAILANQPVPSLSTFTLQSIIEDGFQFHYQTQNPQPYTLEATLHVENQQNPGTFTQRKAIKQAIGTKAIPVFDSEVPPTPGTYSLEIMLKNQRNAPVFTRTVEFTIPKPLAIKAATLIGKQVIKLTAKPAFDAATVTYEITGDGNRKITREATPGANKDYLVEFQAAELPKGNLTIKGIAQGETQRATDELNLENPLNPEWLGTKEGLSDKVPAPWVPVKLQEDKANQRTVIAGQNEIQFVESPFPTQVKNGNIELLAQPIQLKGLHDGKPINWKFDNIKTTEIKETHATFQINATSTTGMTLKGTISVEFDAMIRCDLQLDPRGTLENITLEIPFKGTIAKYLYHYPGRWGSISNSAALPENGWIHPFKPYVWMGNEERGFSWFCESQENWFPYENKSALTITPPQNGKPVTLICTIIDGKFTSQKPLDYTFGFQPTPVKVPEKDAWDYRIVHSGNYGLPERLSDIRRAEPKTWPLKNLVNPSQGTIECWYRPAYPQRERGIPRNERKIGTNHSIVTMRWHEENSSAMTSTNAGFYWNELVQGPVVWSRKSGTVLFAPGKQIDWEPGQWFHLAMTWKDKVRLYVNGELAFETENKGMIPDDPATGTLLVGDNTPEGSIDELRILDVERPPVAPFGPYAKDAHTTLLEHFDTPETLTGLSPRGYQYPTTTTGKFGNCISWGAVDRMPYLKWIRHLGARTICFHEHWSPYQSYPYVTEENRPKLTKLVNACKENDLELLLYMSREFSDNSPVWDLLGDEVLTVPRSGGYTRKPDQKAYYTCWNSVWKDFVLHHLGKMMDEFPIQGWYLDGSEVPGPCKNPNHGCGFVGYDGKTYPKYAIFQTRDFMKRLYNLTRSRRKDGQLNIHNSTVMVTPTLSFGTSTWNGEQLDTHKVGAKTLEVLPMDSFRTELMGYQWGIPSEFLVYEGMPYFARDMISYTILHGVPIRPAVLDITYIMSKLWKLHDEFPFSHAKMLPYWNNQENFQTSAANTYVTAFQDNNKGLLVIISNLDDNNAETTLKINLKNLGFPMNQHAIEWMNQEEIQFINGNCKFNLKPWEFKAIWIKKS